MQDATILCIARTSLSLLLILNSTFQAPYPPLLLLFPDRLRTIIDYDRILVLGAGEVLEYDSPWNLLEDENSAFSELCRKSGEFDELKKLAEAARTRGKNV